MVSNPSVQLAGMNGDRMQDLVKILRFVSVIEIQYWPYKGNGEWGDRRLATGELTVGPVDDSSIHLVDVNDDGLSDVAVVHYDQVRLYLNTGNDSFTRAIVPATTPRYIHGVTQLRMADINGNGSTDFIWQNWDAGRGDYKMEYVDFLPAGRANMLAVMDNAIGLQTHISYKSSTEDYIAATEEGYPWCSFSRTRTLGREQLCEHCSRSFDRAPTHKSTTDVDLRMLLPGQMDRFTDALDGQLPHKPPTDYRLRTTASTSVEVCAAVVARNKKIQGKKKT
jgi:hypothetical protein